MKTAGERIRRLREEREWSQIELAKKANINNSVLSRIEANKRPIENELLVKFAEIFNVTVDYILCRTDSREKPHIITGTGDGSFSFDKDIPMKVREEIINYAEYLIKKYKEGN